MKIRWIFNALAVMEAVLCPALCLMYAFCGLALWTQTVYFCPLLGAVLAALLFSRDKRRFIWKCAVPVCGAFHSGAEAWLVGRCIRCVQCAVRC